MVQEPSFMSGENGWDNKNKENALLKFLFVAQFFVNPLYYRECTLRTVDAAGPPNGSFLLIQKRTLTLTKSKHAVVVLLTETSSI